MTLLYNNTFWIGDHFLTSFRTTCLHSYFTFSSVRPQNDHVYTPAARTKDINPFIDQSANSPAAVSRMGKSFSFNDAQRLSVNGWLYRLGPLQQTVYHHQSVSSVVELKRAIAKAWQKRSRSSKKVSVNVVVFYSARHFCTVYCHSLDGATLFSKDDLNRLCHNVQNKVTSIFAKFGADLITISKDTDHKTWPTRAFCNANNL